MKDDTVCTNIARQWVPYVNQKSLYLIYVFFMLLIFMVIIFVGFLFFAI